MKEYCPRIEYNNSMDPKEGVELHLNVMKINAHHIKLK